MSPADSPGIGRAATRDRAARRPRRVRHEHDGHRLRRDAILVDAGVMFPEPELLGVDLIIPDLRPLQRYRIAALVLTHGHEDHIGAVPHVLRTFTGRLRHAVDAGAGRVQARGRSATRRRRGWCGQAARSRAVGAFTVEFLRVTHSMPDCVALAIETPRGVVIHTGDFKIDPDPARRRARRLPPARPARRRRVLALLADSTNVERRGFTGSEIEVVDAFEEIFTSARGQDRRRHVRVEHLPDADRRRPRGAVRSPGRVRRPRRDRELRDRAAARLSAGAGGVQIRDSDVRNFPLRTWSASAPGRRGSRRRRCPGSPSTITGTSGSTGRRGGLLGPRDSRQREGDRPGDEPRRPAGRRGRLRGHQARPRLGPRQRGRAEAHAFPGQATVFRADTREYRQLARHARVARTVSPGTQVVLAENGDLIRSTTRGPGRRARSPPAGS